MNHQSAAFPQFLFRLACTLLFALAFSSPASAVAYGEVDRLLERTIEAVEAAAETGESLTFPAEGLFHLDRVDYPDGRGVRIDLSRLAEAAQEIGTESDSKRRRKPLEILAATLRATREELAEPSTRSRKRTPDEVLDILKRTREEVSPVNYPGFRDGPAGENAAPVDQCSNVELSGEILAVREKPGTGGKESGTGTSGARTNERSASSSGGSLTRSTAQSPPRIDRPKPKPESSRTDSKLLRKFRSLLETIFAFLATHLKQSLLVGGGTALLLLLFLLWHSYRRARGKEDPSECKNENVTTLRAHDTAALRAEALRLARSGDRRGAIRIFLIALLSLLNDRRVAMFDPSLTNGDYLRLLRARAACHEPLRGPLARFDAIIYGERDADETDVAAFDQAFRELEKTPA